MRRSLILALVLVTPLWAGRSFNGSSDFITISGNGTAVDITGQQITLSAWVQFASVPASTEMEPFAKADTGATQYEMYINAGSQPAKTLGIYVRQSTPLTHDVFMNCATQAVAAPAWNVVTATFSSVTATWSIYCQNALANTGTTGASATIQSNGDALLIGKKAASSPTFCACIVAEFVVYSTALPNALALNSICPVGASARRMGFPKPVGYFPLWGAASPEPDLSGNKLNGTLTGTTAANHAPCTP
jgi:hypothetical protein